MKNSERAKRLSDIQDGKVWTLKPFDTLDFYELIDKYTTSVQLDNGVRDVCRKYNVEPPQLSVSLLNTASELKHLMDEWRDEFQNKLCQAYLELQETEKVLSPEELEQYKKIETAVMDSFKELAASNFGSDDALNAVAEKFKS